MKTNLLALALCAIAAGASADHYMRTADPQVVQAINEIIFALGQGCNAGNVVACGIIPEAQQQAHYMLSAGYDCQQGNQMACQFYQQNLYMLQDAYQQVAYAAQTGTLYQPSQMAGGGAGMGSSHEERMAQIHQWGQDRLEYGRQSQAALDASHERFMSQF